MTFEINFWSLLFGLATLGLSVYTVLYARSKANADEINDVRTDLSARFDTHREKCGVTFSRLGERIQSLETDARKAITHDDLSKLYEKNRELERIMQMGNTQLQQAISELKGEFKQTSSTLGLIHQWLLENRHG